MSFFIASISLLCTDVIAFKQSIKSCNLFSFFEDSNSLQAVAQGESTGIADITVRNAAPYLLISVLSSFIIFSNWVMTKYNPSFRKKQTEKENL